MVGLGREPVSWERLISELLFLMHACAVRWPVSGPPSLSLSLSPDYALLSAARGVGRHSQRRACCTCCCKPLLHAFHRLRAAKPQQHTLPQVGTSQAQVPFRRLRLASRLAGRGSCGATHAPHRVAVRIRRSSEGCLAHKDRSRTSPTNPSLAGGQKCPGRGLNPRHLRYNNEGSYTTFSKVPRTGFEPAPLA